MGEVILRHITKSDYAQVESMIKQTWHFEKHCGNNISANRMAKLYLYDAIVDQNCIVVAEENDEIIGAIMMRDDKNKAKSSVCQRTARFFAMANVVRSKHGRRGCRLYKNVNAVDKSLRDATGRNFGGELTFFAVADKAQGKGVGKRLVAEAREYFREKNHSSFYVFTDTACNYGFYDSQGFRKIGKKELNTYHNNQSHFTYFMYEYVF